MWGAGHVWVIDTGVCSLCKNSLSFTLMLDVLSSTVELCFIRIIQSLVLISVCLCVSDGGLCKLSHI